ncbi:MAG TPA: UDP-2,3-diacylglucosamine diphosphatase LpxI [Gemmataceae bacterium]|nr:UDP-2,3-diacylglucosamine diphosphatase LpxI [Gemmataceae bacterium]
MTEPRPSNPPVTVSPCHPVTGSPRQPIGLLAGSGRFPILFAQKARDLGIPVVCVGIRYEASPELAGLVSRFYWVGIARLGRMIRCFKRAGVRRAVMAGKITKAVMHTPWRMLSLLPDWRTVWAWYTHRRPDNRDDTLLLAIIQEFAKDGIRFESALDLCPELLVNPGVLTRRRPTSQEEKDIEFGWELAKEMGRLDVGQSVAVKERCVLAVEAIEGTDQAIVRAGTLCRSGGFVVVKVAKPHQDMRFDVPTVGCQTIRSMHQAGGRVLAIEAGKTIIIDPEETIRLADRLGITIVAR